MFLTNLKYFFSIFSVSIKKEEKEKIEFKQSLILAEFFSDSLKEIDGNILALIDL